LKKILRILFYPIEWLFDYEFYWWFRAERRNSAYQKQKEFLKEKEFCRIKGIVLIILGVGIQAGCIIYCLKNSSLSVLVAEALMIAACGISCFLVLFGLLHIFATGTKPQPKN
jgi:hypothetical protein